MPLTSAQFASEVAVVSVMALAIALPTMTQLPGVRSSVATVVASGAPALMNLALKTLSEKATTLPPAAPDADPDTPAGPCGPCGPIAPGLPCGPCGPVGPTAPATPATPCGPVGPT